MDRALPMIPQEEGMFQAAFTVCVVFFLGSFLEFFFKEFERVFRVLHHLSVDFGVPGYFREEDLVVVSDFFASFVL